MKKLFLLLTLLVGLFSCSDSETVNLTKTISVGNEIQTDRITFYNSPTSRSVESFPSIGSEPTIPQCPSYKSPNEARGEQDYVLEGGQGQISVNGNVYITGNVKTHNIHGEGTVYVMPSGKLTLSSGFNNQNAKIVVFGTIETEGGLNLGGQILVKNNFTINGDLNVSGTVVSDELTVTGKIQFNGGMVKGNCIDVQAVNMSGGGELAVGSYLSCQSLYMGNTAQVYLDSNAMIQVTDITTMTSNNCRFTSSGHALLSTNKFHVEGGADNPEYVGGMFNKDLKIKYTTLENCNPAFVDKFIPSATEYYIPKDGCNPGNGNKDNKPFTPIAIVESPEHGHTHLSATCIQQYNDLTYVSYHLNEEYKDNKNYSIHMGCVEMFDIAEDHANILAWLMDDTFDYNHITLYNNKVYGVGSNKTGAALSVVTTNGLGFDSKAEYVELTDGGISGNCIIRDNNLFRIASYEGFQTLDANTLKVKEPLKETKGSAKYIAKKNNTIVTLNLDDVVTVNTPGNSYNFKTKTITPKDGKNVIVLDGEYIYVALGENGVAKYDLTGNLEADYNWIEEKLETKPDYKGKPCANGLCVDDKYVYVANGAAGLIVLDKNTMKRVARYSRKSELYSANFVQKVNDLIYIAYGRYGLEVVKMNDK